MTFQYKHNKRTLSVNIKFISTCLKTERKTPQRLAILPVSISLTNEFYICLLCMYIVYKRD